MPNYNYYPQYYPTQYNAYPTQMNVGPTQPTQSGGIIWVQGIEAAKSYLVGAGQSVLLMDSESSAFYIKSTDASGMPMPLRVFEYKERTQDAGKAPAVTQQVDLSGYVTQEEFEAFKKSLRKGDDDEQPFV